MKHQGQTTSETTSIGMRVATGSMTRSWNSLLALGRTAYIMIPKRWIQPFEGWCSFESVPVIRARSPIVRDPRMAPFRTSEYEPEGRCQRYAEQVDLDFRGGNRRSDAGVLARGAWLRA